MSSCAEATGALDARLDQHRRARRRSSRSWRRSAAAAACTARVTDFRVDDDQLSVTFKGPGYSADASIDRKTGKYELTESRLGLVAIANDLHKGRDTGAMWKLLIDISAGLLTFISLTGLILLYYIHKHRLAGVILLVAGAALAGMLYMMGVP